MSDVVYLQIVKRNKSGKYVYEGRNGEHKAVTTSKQYPNAAAAAQAAADEYPGLEVRR